MSRGLWLAWLACCVACGSSSPPPAGSARSQPAPRALCDYYDYRFELAADLREMTAMVCFDGPPPRALVCGPQGDAEHAPRAERISGEQVTPLATAGCRIDLGTLTAGDCVRYTIDLRAIDRTMPMSLVESTPTLVAADVGVFLYRPDVRADSLHGHATLMLPEGARASLPWRRDADGYLLDRSAFEQVGYAVFGAFESERIETSGATLEVAITEALAPDTRAAIVPWMQAVVHTSLQIGGTFPAERAQIILVPQAGAGGVGFGMVGRGGGPSLAFVLGRESSQAELIESWEPAHEVVHLRTPFVVRADRWLTEGIATYYQEVLRARAGIVTAAQAWKRLHRGLLRGAQGGTGRTLRDESADMFSTGAFQRVYWAGVAFALMADVELRRGSDNAVSLDAVVLGLQACCAESSRAWTVVETLARMDALAGRPVFSELAQQQLDQTELPDLTAQFSALGITIGEEDAVLDPGSPLAAVRDAIMTPVVPAAAAAR